MGFFKNLKERLFTLNDEETSKLKKKKKVIETEQVNLEDYGFEDHGPSFNSDSVSKVGTISFDDDDDDINEFSFTAPKKDDKSKLKEEKKLKKQRIKNKKIDKYVAGMNKSGSSFSRRLKELQTKHNEIDDDYFDDLEEVLIMSDISVQLVMNIIYEIKQEVRNENIKDFNLINEIIADKMFIIYANQSEVDTRFDIHEGRVNVILMVGVNGVGKTTSIAKLANKYMNEGKKVLIAAADTFRAGAVKQLDVWANRLNCQIVKPERNASDPASVVFDAVKKAKDEAFDILIIDTAGRLQNKVNLMSELAKMKNIISAKIHGAPHEIVLVLDATTGQNGISQAREFRDVTNVTGIILTKMDGTSKGGIVLTIKDELNLPVKFIGFGEQMDDLQEFDLDAFIYGLTKDLIK
ncbi:MAG: signal recognition particle-docking protein FtsY [Mycoplasma sp.]|nr:signal recognition particle-docking protein FtsY [Mycoplasma sp.]